MIIYLHGFASGPRTNSPKLSLLRALGAEVRCLDTRGCYRPEGYLRAADELLVGSQAPSLLVGSSLGGFWARRLGSQLRCPWIGLNPALRPSETLASHPGPLQRFDIEAMFDWGIEDALAYRPYEQEPVDESVASLIVVAEDDDVVDHRQTLALAAGTEVLVLPGGGHDLAKTTDYADAVRRFVNRIEAVDT
jgi:predicted esterase YcpF (UPF0227 family)